MTNITLFKNNYLPIFFSQSVLLMSFFIFFSILLISWQITPSPHVDNGFYLKLSQGIPVILPFSKRILYPFFAKSLDKLTGIGLEQSFMLANTVALFVLIFSVTFLINKLTSSLTLSILLLFNPFIIRSFKEAILPDLFFAALLSMLFIFLYYDLLWPSLFMLFLLYFTRDNALFVCLSLVFAAWWQGRVKWAVAGLMVIPLATILLSFATSGSGGENLYKISNILYMIFKVPKNLLYNVFGILIWNNIHPTVGIPYIKIAIPAWLPMGALHTLGICPWEPTIPLRTVTLILTTFGILPLLLAFTLVRDYRVVKVSSFWLLVALIFGCSSFLVGIMISLDVIRQIGYAWPAFWLATPILLKKHYQLPKPIFYRLAFCHIALCWAPWFLTPWLVTRYQDQVPLSIIYTLLVALFLHLFALKTLFTLPKLCQPSY